MSAPEIERLIQLLARLPGLGPRSARRAVLAMIQKPDALLSPLAAAMRQTAEAIRTCSVCGNLETRDPCSLCRNSGRYSTVICVVEEIGDLWALERSGAFKGRYHVIGGKLSALDGRGPEQLNIARLVERLRPGASVTDASAEAPVTEVILALSATVDGQTTAHYIADRLAEFEILVSRLAHGIPVGGELDYLDDGTLSAALKARRPV